MSRTWAVFGVLSAAALSGCGPAEESQAPPAAAPIAEAEPEADQQATPPAAEPPKPSKTSVYRPPFPGRTDLFTPVRRKRVASNRDDDSGESVVLKGFAHVDQPKAVLAIDGRLTAIGAGAERYGVQVISIQPPKVVLQRGRSRWTATLE